MSDSPRDDAPEEVTDAGSNEPSDAKAGSKAKRPPRPNGQLEKLGKKKKAGSKDDDAEEEKNDDEPEDLEDDADADDGVDDDDADDDADDSDDDDADDDDADDDDDDDDDDDEDDEDDEDASPEAAAASTPPEGSDKPAESDAAPDSDAAPGSDRPRGAIITKLFGRTDVGQIREHNEDNLLIANLSSKVRGIGGSAKTIELGDGGLLMAVCDGMGGAAAGEVASQLATDIIYQRMANHAGHNKRDQLALDVVDALEIAGTRILQEANNNRACRGMGTTATVAALVDDELLLGQVGDSRAYLLRGDRLVQVTRDQSLVNQLIEAGQLTEEEAENFEHSNIILQALGTAEAVQVDLTHAPLRRGDVLMMCSDGLSGMIRNNEIAETLTNVPDPVEACRVLIDDANQAGGHDNITVIVAVFDGEGLLEATVDDVEDLKYEKFALPAWGGSHRHGIDDEETYDSTPSIEITGEFDVGPHTNWDDVLDDKPSIPKEAGPALSSVAIWVCLIGVVIAFYFLFFAR